MNYVRTCFVALTFALSAMAHAGGDASDGHSHGEAAAPAMTVAGAPRASAQTEEFELVAVLGGKKLTLYLDRFATNEPVADAQIEVDSSTLKAGATQIAAGVYSLPGESFAKPGKYPLAISVQAGDSSDLLTLTLDLPQPVAGAAAVDSWNGWAWNNWAVAGAAGALLLAGAAVVAVRRRKSLNQRGN